MREYCVTCKAFIPRSEFNLVYNKNRPVCSYHKKLSKLDKRAKRYKDFTGKKMLEMVLDQNYKCDICKEEFIHLSDAHIDHCHKSEEVRGLLCRGCNTGIGMLKEDTNTLENAITYINKHKKLK